MSDQITFSTPPAVPDGFPDYYYIFKADEVDPDTPMADIGGQVQSAAAAAIGTLDYITALYAPRLTLKGRIKNLWLVLKNPASGTSSASYAIVIDMLEAFQFIDPDKLGVIGSVINADVRLKLTRIVYSFNLEPDLDGKAREDIFEGIPNLYWPNEFTAGIYGEFSFVFNDTQIAFRPVFSVFKYDKWGQVVKDPEETGEPENPSPDQTTNADNKGKAETKNIAVQQRTPSLSIDTLLVTFKGEGLSIIMDAGITLGPLTGELITFDLEIDFLDMSITPKLRGVGFAYDQPPISLAGAVLKDGTGSDVTYNGGLAIGLTEWAMVAFASFGMVEIDGVKIPSIFIYGYLGGELINIEGIASLTGLAVAIGMNRELKTLKDMSAIPDHPLIKAASATAKKPIKLPALVKMVKKLNAYVPKKEGSLFFGLGAKGNLVELFSLYALPVLTLDINLDEDPPMVDDIKIQIYGLASLALPQATKTLSLELAIIENFLLKDKEILIGGALTENSGIKIAPGVELKLTGSFAFYFAPALIGSESSPFVYTVGGYGRLLNPDPNWPVVAPLTLSWSPIKGIDLAAKFNFAVTTKCMAVGFNVNGSAHFGGKLYSAGVSWDIGFSSLMQWSPFLYKGEIHAEFHAYVRAWMIFTTAEKNFDIQAELNIWGGENTKFSGKGELHVNLLFSINLAIGWGEEDDETQLQPISWDKFKSSFLPHTDDNSELQLAGIKVTKGMAGMMQVESDTAARSTSDTDTTKQYNIIRPDALEIKIDGVLPSTAIHYNDTAQGLNGNEQQIGIQTMGFTADLYRSALNPSMHVTIKKDGVKLEDGKLDLTIVNANVPASLWKAAAHAHQHTDIDPHGEYQILEVPKGMLIKALPPSAGDQFDISKSALEFTVHTGGDIAHQQQQTLLVGAKSTETAVTQSMSENLPDATVLNALGITTMPSFSPLKDTDLEAIPYLV